MWRRDSPAGARLDPGAVARSLQQTLAPLFSAPLHATTHADGAAAIVFLERPVAGWRAPFRQRDAGGRAFAVDYPIGVPRVMAACGHGPPPADGELPALGRALAEDPEPLLRELPPPFSLVWWPDDGSGPLVQTDGLGRAQVLEYDDGALWAATNKVAALHALGVGLELDPGDWAVKSAVGWFPMARTGYRHVRYLAPGTQLRVERGGVRRRVDDVVREWVHPPAMGPEDALELGRAALVRHVRDGAPYFDRPAAGLTGGWDTRAVVSAFVAAGVGVRAKVKGREGSLDVAIARRLATIAGLELDVLDEADLPPDSADALERSIRLALLWQGGLMWSEAHKAFRSGDARALDRPGVNVMGQHGEIARGAYERRIKAWKAAGPEEYEDVPRSPTGPRAARSSSTGGSSTRSTASRSRRTCRRGRRSSSRRTWTARRAGRRGPAARAGRSLCRAGRPGARLLRPRALLARHRRPPRRTRARGRRRVDGDLRCRRPAQRARAGAGGGGAGRARGRVGCWKPPGLAALRPVTWCD